MDHTIFYDRRDLLMTGSERIIWVFRVSIESWCYADSAGKITVLPNPGVWVMERIMSFRCFLLEVS